MLGKSGSGGKSMTRAYGITLDEKLAAELCDVIYEQPHIAITKKYEQKATSAWDCTCAIVDRINDTTQYLNGITIEEWKYQLCPFDFFAFVSNADVLIGCIDTLAKIYSVDLSSEDQDTSIFNEPGHAEKGSDKKYFRYLRSLCVTHPINTDRHPEYQVGKFEYCPFVTWSKEQATDDRTDLRALVYTNDNDSNEPGFDKSISIRIPEVIEFVGYRYGLLRKIIDGIETHQQDFEQRFRKELMKMPEDFDQYTEYLSYFKKERKKRTGNYDDYEIFDYLIQLFDMNISDERNRVLFDEYRRAFRIAMTHEHNATQNMSWKGFLNTGIEDTDGSETTLLKKLFNPSPLSALSSSLSHNLNMVKHLGDNANSRKLAHIMLKNEEVQAFLANRVYLNEDLSDFELCLLINLALFKCAKEKQMPWLSALQQLDTVAANDICNTSVS
jgi:hypothetical protein